MIESDLEARPDYAPWIAALWVEPDRRRRGVGTALLDAARARAAGRRRGPCFLCAVPNRTGFYAARGFRRIEEGVKGLNVFVAEG